jgi:hypothetical protein
VSRVDHQPNAAARAVASDLLDRVAGDYAATRFNLAGATPFCVTEEDSTELARALSAEMPPEAGEATPRYVRVLFGDLERVPKPGQYIVVSDEEGRSDICCVLSAAGYDVGLDVPGAPWMPGEALIAVWALEDLEGAA